ncbi:MAG: AAA family ATPase [bacterium]|nr:AAA family ATPase [bacterium]
MFLKALTLKGFKSFADPTTLVFEPGVTAIVGPNGSGKSNVVDAVAWALGAQAPTSVRSAKMDDVIFAGTAARAGLGRAEVSLSIDNASRLLPIDFEDVTITRTLFRSGDSTYAINGVPCRLLDVQELLSDSGVGRQQHVIVSQRQIEGVLSARPEDRRAVIEEAAGVLKHRRRKEKSERRLAASEANLNRLSDVVREIRRQLKPLERQAEAVRRHGGLVAELSGVRRFLAGREIDQLRRRVRQLTQDQASGCRETQQITGRVEALGRELAAAEARLSEADGSDTGRALLRFEGSTERLRGLEALLAERRLRLLRDRSAGVDEDLVASLEAESDRLGQQQRNRRPLWGPMRPPSTMRSRSSNSSACRSTSSGEMSVRRQRVQRCRVSRARSGSWRLPSCGIKQSRIASAGTCRSCSSAGRHWSKSWSGTGPKPPRPRPLSDPGKRSISRPSA